MPTYLFYAVCADHPPPSAAWPGDPAGADRAVRPCGWRRTIPTGRMPPPVCRGLARGTGSAPTATAVTLSRLLYGARPALGLVALVTAITLPVGLLVGILRLLWRVAGANTDAVYRRGDVDAAADPRLRVRDDARPGLVNGAGVSPDYRPAYARQARSEIQRLRHSDYLAAAEMLGIRGGRLLVGHILPLCLPSAIVRLALDLAGIILAAAGLGFGLWRSPADGGVGSDD